MNKESKRSLNLYQCEYNRNIEESFASMLSERNNLRLFFVNENQAFTDGVNIVTDPAKDGMFCDTEALRRTEDYIGIPNTFSSDMYSALQMVTRCQNVHETLHIIYTTFPPYCTYDERGTTKIRSMVLSLISNVIEDAFIEAAGAGEFDNMRLFLMFGRVSRLFSNTPSEGTAQRAFSGLHTENAHIILEYIDYFATMLLYPMISLGEPSGEISEYVLRTKHLFEQGSMCGEPRERYRYTQMIFDEIEDIIPKEDDKEFAEALENLQSTRLGGVRTHISNSSSIVQFAHEGKTAVALKKLFDGKYDPTADYDAVISQFLINKSAALAAAEEKTLVWEYTGSELEASAVHKNIRIKVTKPKPNLNMKTAYRNIYNKYRLNINSYNARFRQMLKGIAETYESNCLFGSKIASERLGDVKKRYWSRKVSGTDVPDIAILLLIDGSGSMEGARCNGAMTAAVVLHEVLSKNNIEHAIAEHRAVFGEPLVRHNVLIDFNSKPNDKYNILMLDADDGTREGLSLMWAKKYIEENSFAERKVIIAVSDGVPYHITDDSVYEPPVSVMDTKNAAEKICRSGIDIIAVALDDEDDFNCYEELKQIYRHTIACSDIKQLTGQILALISKLISQN